MKKLSVWLILGICTLTSGAAVATAGKPDVKERQRIQQRRIAHGARSGDLTRPELRRLERNAVRIHRSILRDRRDSGVFTQRERAQAHKRLNRQSRAIYRQTHDPQTR